MCIVLDLCQVGIRVKDKPDEKPVWVDLPSTINFKPENGGLVTELLVFAPDEDDQPDITVLEDKSKCFKVELHPLKKSVGGYAVYQIIYLPEVLLFKLCDRKNPIIALL